MILPNYLEYCCFDYESERTEINGFALGEIVYDHTGQIGIIVQIFSDGDIRCNSNGICHISDVKPCPSDKADERVSLFRKIRELSKIA